MKITYQNLRNIFDPQELVKEVVCSILELPT